MFEPLKDIADPVAVDEPVGRIHYPEQIGRAPTDVASPYGGIVLCKRALGRVVCGDAIVQIAHDAE